MAEILPSGSHRATSINKKASTRVDLTPMVDLGFLLITFFIFTTALAKPNAINLNMPADGNSTKTSASKTLSLILDKNNEIFYYRGTLPLVLQRTTYSAFGIRRVIDSSMQQVKITFGDKTQTTILIKPTSNSNYQNLVDVLDEMTINGVTRYVVMDVDDAEKKLITNFRAN